MRKLEAWWCRERRAEGMEGRWQKGRSEDNLRKYDDQIGGRTVRERTGRNILIVGAIMEIVRYLALGKIPGIQKDIDGAIH